jgi:hypothetical protein
LLIEEKEEGAKKSEDKKAKLKKDIEEVMLEHNAYVREEAEQRRTLGVTLKGEQQKQFFPFTHGDHIERQRKEMREEMQEKVFQNLKKADKVIIGGV